MNILFLSLSAFGSYEEHGIYASLMRKIAQKGHAVYTILPKKTGEKTAETESLGGKIVKIDTGAVTGKVGLIKKGLNTLRLGGRYKRAIKRYFKNVKFDLVLYSSPPITLLKAIKYAKKRDGAKTYLLLKDIFPQNAVDLGILTTGGLKGLIYRHFRRVEKKYYAVSDKIGCMSAKNAEYLLRHNPWIDPEKIEINPNSVDTDGLDERKILSAEDRAKIRAEYKIPEDKRVFIYGGNLGKPQNVEYVVNCLKEEENKTDRFFVICGNGNEYGKLERFFEEERPSGMLLIGGLPGPEYERLCSACDVGLIFLDHRFTIPNYPSRLLSYLSNGLPVLCCTDKNTDAGDDAVRGGYGWKCESDDVSSFAAAADEICRENTEEMRINAIACLKKYFSTEEGAEKIIRFASSCPSGEKSPFAKEESPTTKEGNVKNTQRD